MLAHVDDDPAGTADPLRLQIKPLLFLSKMLTQAECNYWPTKLEIACLVWAVKHTRWMIESCTTTITVLTHHRATSGIVDKTALTSTAVNRLNMRLVNASQNPSGFSNIKIVHILAENTLCQTRCLDWPTTNQPTGKTMFSMTCWYQ